MYTINLRIIRTVTNSLSLRLLVVFFAKSSGSLMVRYHLTNIRLVIATD